MTMYNSFSPHGEPTRDHYSGNRQQHDAIVNAHETASYLSLTNQTIMMGTNDAEWLFRFMESNDREKLVNTLKTVFDNGIDRHPSEAVRQLQLIALTVTMSLAQDVQLTSLLGSKSDPNSVFKSLEKFADEAKDMTTSRDPIGYDSQQEEVLLFTTRVEQVYDRVNRAVSELPEMSSPEQPVSRHDFDGMEKEEQDLKLAIQQSINTAARQRAVEEASAATRKEREEEEMRIAIEESLREDSRGLAFRMENMMSQYSRPSPRTSASRSSAPRSRAAASPTRAAAPPSLAAAASAGGGDISIVSDSSDSKPPTAGNGMEAYYKTQLETHRFEFVSALEDHAYSHMPNNSWSSQTLRRVTRELNALSHSLPVSWGSSIFVRAIQDRPELIRILIIGARGTPYSNGCFLFDMYLPDTYPSEPPQVVFLTTGGSTVEFHPMLEKSGKVCLSLIKTHRHGQPWRPYDTSLLQVLLALQSLLWSSDLSDEVKIRRCTARIAIQDFVSMAVAERGAAYPELVWPILTHFGIKSAVIEDQIRDWARLDSTLNGSQIFRLLRALKEQHPDICEFEEKKPSARDNESQRHEGRLGSGNNEDSARRRSDKNNRRDGRSSSNENIQRRRSDDRHREDAAGDNGKIKISVRIPPNVNPGEEFFVMVDDWIHHVTCPDLFGGTKWDVMVKDPKRMDLETYTSPNVQSIGPKAPGGYLVFLPYGVPEGETVHVYVDGGRYEARFPPGCQPGTPIKIYPHGKGGRAPPPRTQRVSREASPMRHSSPLDMLSERPRRPPIDDEAMTTATDMRRFHRMRHANPSHQRRDAPSVSEARASSVPKTRASPPLLPPPLDSGRVQKDPQHQRHKRHVSPLSVFGRGRKNRSSDMDAATTATAWRNRGRGRHETQTRSAPPVAKSSHRRGSNATTLTRGSEFPPVMAPTASAPIEARGAGGNETDQRGSLHRRGLLRGRRRSVAALETKNGKKPGKGWKALTRRGRRGSARDEQQQQLHLHSTTRTRTMETPVGDGGASSLPNHLQPTMNGVAEFQSHPVPRAEPPRRFRLTVPPGIFPGEWFNAEMDGEIVAVTCPENCRPGMSFQYEAPPKQSNKQSPARSPYLSPPNERNDSSNTYHFAVEVPDGVRPGDTFPCSVNGTPVRVQCPADARPGMTIHMSLDEALMMAEQYRLAEQKRNEIGIDYNCSREWSRVMRDRSFYWYRSMENSSDLNSRVFGRNMDYEKPPVGNNRSGKLTVVPIEQAKCPAEAKTVEGSTVTAREIGKVKGKSFEERMTWFRNICSRLRIDRNRGFMAVNLRREYLFMDSVQSIMSLTRVDLVQDWSIRYVGQNGYMTDQEMFQWYQAIMKEVFKMDLGLWQYSSNRNELRMQIHPASEHCCEDHLQYYRFCGRIMGKALLEGRPLLTAPVDPYIYKMIVGWPLQLKDLESVDEELYHSLVDLNGCAERGENLESFGHKFTTTRTVLGKKQTLSLVQGGHTISVTNDNFEEFIEANLKYRLVECVKPQLTELLVGIYDVVPEPVLAAFDHVEIEKLMTFRQ